MQLSEMTEVEAIFVAEYPNFRDLYGKRTLLSFVSFLWYTSTAHRT